MVEGGWVWSRGALPLFFGKCHSWVGNSANSFFFLGGGGGGEGWGGDSGRGRGGRALPGACFINIRYNSR